MQTLKDIPSLAQLALEYGTISDAQYTHINRVCGLLGKDHTRPDYGALLLEEKMATRYQVELLKLIQEYHIVRRKGEEFGKIAVQKGFATETDIRNALEIQKKEFRKSRIKKLIGDILVESGVITAKQKAEILKEQVQLEDAANKIIENSGSRPAEQDDPIQLTEYEQDFLRIKSLDEEFSAAVLEKRMATLTEVDRAKKIQEEEFEKNQTVKILGDIMVSLNLITREQKDLILQAQKRLEDMNREHVPPRITVSEDAMSAWIELDPESPPATLDSIKAVLSAEGLSRGLYPDEMLHCRLSLGFKRFPVARTDLFLTLKEVRKLESKLDEDLNERGEKRKGDILARQSSTWNISSQKDVYGRRTTAESKLDFTVRCGNGTRMSRDKTGIVASKTGVPSLSVDRFLHLHPIIHVLEDADQRYGPIEAYANLTVSGTITGAYPITAGNVTAREIRGGIIDAIGDIRVQVGITDAVIRTQGDVHARYLHNCRIEAFGSVYVENEIFDSDIRCSGRFDCPDCRLIASNVYARDGVVLAGIGSQKTMPCTVVAGTDHHILQVEQSIDEAIETATSTIRDLEAEKETHTAEAKKIFQKMVDLKIFHDKAKQNRDKYFVEIKHHKSAMDEAQSQKTLLLIRNFDKRMESAIASLKTLNKGKKVLDQKINKIDRKIAAVTPGIGKKVLELERTRFAFLEWARFQRRTPEIKVRGKGFQGATFAGIYSRIQIDADSENFIVREDQSNDKAITISPLNQDSVA